MTDDTFPEATLDITVFVTGVRRDEGTVVVLEGVMENGQEVIFAADWRMARDIAEALQAGERPECSVPGWAVLGVAEADPAVLAAATLSPEALVEAANEALALLGDEGQDHESYTDDQDHESYTVDEDAEYERRADK